LGLSSGEIHPFWTAFESVSLLHRDAIPPSPAKLMLFTRQIFWIASHYNPQIQFFPIFPQDSGAITA
jgi:hypothetical protein